MFTAICKQCGKEFQTWPCRIKIGSGKYCSRVCQLKGMAEKLTLDLIGQRFGRLTVFEKTEKRKFGSVVWLCKCDCGKMVEVSTMLLRNGDTKSCGCLQKEMAGQNIQKAIKKITTHGDSKTRLYNIWSGMLARCYKSWSHNFDRYGGRGIEVCSEWQESYPMFKTWALANGYKRGLTIDRKDNNQGYNSKNCQWISKSANSIKMLEDQKQSIQRGFIAAFKLGYLAGRKSISLQH